MKPDRAFEKAEQVTRRKLKKLEEGKILFKVGRIHHWKHKWDVYMIDGKYYKVRE